mgnify:CR=1 FL=1
MPDIASFIQQFAIMALPVLLAITVHEVAHGYVAFLLGDPTAKNAGRLTLNPIKHLDLVGTIALFLIHIGWAKPVPINAAFFANPKKGLVLVSIAGPAANFLLAVVFALLFHIVSPSGGLSGIAGLGPVQYMFLIGVIVNIGLGIFNLLPIPPLDGSNILLGILPPRLGNMLIQYRTYGFLVLVGFLIVLFASDVPLIKPLINRLTLFLLPA